MNAATTPPWSPPCSAARVIRPFASSVLTSDPVPYSIVMDREFTDRLLQTARPSAIAAGDPQTVLYAAFSAIVQGDYDAFGELVADDVELSICGFSAIDGTWRGRAAVVEATRKNFALLSGQQPEIERIIF